MSSAIASALKDLRAATSIEQRDRCTAQLVSAVPRALLAADTPDSGALRRLVLQAAGGAAALKQALELAAAARAPRARAPAPPAPPPPPPHGAFLAVAALVADRALLDAEPLLAALAPSVVEALEAVAAEAGADSARAAAAAPALAAGVRAVAALLAASAAAHDAHNAPAAAPGSAPAPPPLDLASRCDFGALLRALAASAAALAAARAGREADMGDADGAGGAGGADADEAAALALDLACAALRRHGGWAAGPLEAGAPLLRRRDACVLRAASGGDGAPCGDLVGLFRARRSAADAALARRAGEALLALLRAAAELRARDDGGRAGAPAPAPAPTPAWAAQLQAQLVEDIARPDEGAGWGAGAGAEAGAGAGAGTAGDGADMVDTGGAALPVSAGRPPPWRPLALRILGALLDALEPGALAPPVSGARGGTDAARAPAFALLAARLVGAELKLLLDEAEALIVLARGAGGVLAPPPPPPPAAAAGAPAGAPAADADGDASMASMEAAAAAAAAAAPAPAPMSPSDRGFVRRHPLRGVAPLSRAERTARLLGGPAPRYEALVDAAGAGVEALCALARLAAALWAREAAGRSGAGAHAFAPSGRPRGAAEQAGAAALVRLHEALAQSALVLLSFASDAWASELRPLLALPLAAAGVAAAPPRPGAQAAPPAAAAADEQEEASLPWRAAAAQPLLALCAAGACPFLAEAGAEVLAAEFADALPCLLSERAAAAAAAGVPRAGALAALAAEAAARAAAAAADPDAPRAIIAVRGLAAASPVPLPDSGAGYGAEPGAAGGAADGAADAAQAALAGPRSVAPPPPAPLHAVLQLVGARLDSRAVAAAAFGPAGSGAAGAGAPAAAPAASDPASAAAAAAPPPPLVPAALDLVLRHCRAASLALMRADSAAARGAAPTRALLAPALLPAELRRARETCRALLDLCATPAGAAQLAALRGGGEALAAAHRTCLVAARRLCGRRARALCAALMPLPARDAEALLASCARHLLACSAAALRPLLPPRPPARAAQGAGARPPAQPAPPAPPAPRGFDPEAAAEELRDAAFEMFQGVHLGGGAEGGGGEGGDEGEGEGERLLLDLVLDAVGTPF